MKYEKVILERDNKRNKNNYFINEMGASQRPSFIYRLVEEEKAEKPSPNNPTRG